MRCIYKIRHMDVPHGGRFFNQVEKIFRSVSLD